MTLGSHTVSHPVLSKLDRASQMAEIRDSFAFLEQVCGALYPKTFCYPYGGFHSFTAETQEILNEENCVFSFNVEPRNIELADTRANRQALPRFDCNAFRYGQCR
jgi:peptidoglycan/xylan/chitin deacetylase (PgdA/CDA1 family)